jgi:hypothetical protein
MLGYALLCGKDKHLLDTRARLLQFVQVESVVALAVGELEGIPSQLAFGLAVLGQLLTRSELEEAISIVRRRWPAAKILIFHLAADAPGRPLADCEYLTTLESPQVFLEKAKRLLEAR